MGLSTISIGLLLGISPFILPIHPPDEHARVEDSKEDEPQDDGMTLNEPRGAVVDMGSHDGEALAEDLSHGPRGAALGKSSRVDTQPAHEQDHAGI